MAILSDPSRTVSPRTFTFASPTAIGGLLTLIHRVHGRDIAYDHINHIDVKKNTLVRLLPAELLALRKHGLTPPQVKLCQKRRADSVTVLIQNEASFYIVVYDPNMSYATHRTWTALQPIASSNKAWDVLNEWFPENYGDAADRVDMSYTSVEDQTQYRFVLDCPPTKPDLHAYIQKE